MAWFDSLGKTLESVFDEFYHWMVESAGFENWFKSITRSGMTDADKEAAALGLYNQQVLNDEEYQRKIDFYERYESFPAQVKQYQQAGFNPMLLANGGQAGASATGGVGSAGSADATSQGGSAAGLLSLIGTLSGISQKRQQMQQDKELRSYENETRRMQVENYGRYLDELTRRTSSEADFLEMSFGTRLNAADLDVKTKQQNLEYIQQLCNSEQVRQKLMRSGIKLNDANAAAVAVQTAIMTAQEKYSDRYFKAVAELQEAQASMQSVDASIYEKTKDARLKAAIFELSHVIISAGIDGAILESPSFAKACAGEMTKKEKAEFWGRLVPSVVGAVGVVGGVALKATAASAARGIVPPSYAIPANMQPGFTMDYGI